jgi:hypothetical protein
LPEGFVAKVVRGIVVVLKNVLEVVVGTSVEDRGSGWQLPCCPPGGWPAGFRHGPVDVDVDADTDDVVDVVATVVVPILAATGPVTLSAISAAIIIANVKTVKIRFFTGFHLLFPFPGWSNSLFTLKTDPTTDSTTTLET